MNSDAKSVLEQQLRDNGAGNFIPAVAKAAAAGVDVIMTLSAFVDEPELLYAALRYASLVGVSVVVPPQTGPERAAP